MKMKKETGILKPGAFNFSYCTLDNSHLKLRDANLIPNLSKNVGLPLIYLEHLTSEEGHRFLSLKFELPELSEDALIAIEEEERCGVELVQGPLKGMKGLTTPRVTPDYIRQGVHYLEIRVQTYSAPWFPDYFSFGEKHIQPPWKAVDEIRLRSEGIGQVLKPILEKLQSPFATTEREQYKLVREKPIAPEEGAEGPKSEKIIYIETSRGGAPKKDRAPGDREPGE